MSQLDTFIEKHKEYIRDLSLSDVGKTVIKIVAKKDFSYYNYLYRVEDITKSIKICGNDVCRNNGTKMCNRCRSEHYCSKECQIQKWAVHKGFCTPYTEQKYRPEIDLIPLDELEIKERRLIPRNERIKEQYLSGWIDVVHVENLKELRSLLGESNQRRFMGGKLERRYLNAYKSRGYEFKFDEKMHKG